MPAIRKKTSKRGTTFQRSKITKKARETRKKNKRDAKRDPTWKSKVKKEVTVPNSAPFKEEILNEMSLARRTAAEEKLRKRQERMQIEKDEGVEEYDANEISTLLNGPSSSQEDETPVFAQPQQRIVSKPAEYQSLGETLEHSDVVLQVLDARDPMAFRNSALESSLVSEGKTVVLVLNKADLIPKESALAWLALLRTAFPSFISSSPLSTTTTTTSPSQSLSNSNLLQFIQSKSAHSKSPLTVTAVGLPGVGKSTVLNGLTGCSTFIAKSPDSIRTAMITDRRVSSQFRQATDPKTNLILIDCPAYNYSLSEDYIEDPSSPQYISDVLRNNVGRIERIKNPELAVDHLLKRVVEQAGLLLLYTLPIFPEGDIDAFLKGAARSKGRLRKGGVADLTSTAKAIMQDWSHGRFPYYTMPIAPSSATNCIRSEECSNLKSLKDIQKDGPLVKLYPSSVDMRIINLQAASVEASSSEEEAEEDEDMDEEITSSMEEGEDDSQSTGDEEMSEGEPEVFAPASQSMKKVIKNVARSRRIETPKSRSKDVRFAAAASKAPKSKPAVRVSKPLVPRQAPKPSEGTGFNFLNDFQ